MTTPSLETVIERAVRFYLAEVNTAIPAEVVTYDASNQSCSVKPGIRRQYKDQTIVERATITDVPVVFPGAGGGLLSFPIKPGDTVLLIFSQRSIDRWVRGDGGDVVPGDNRKHAYADAIAIPGLVPFANADDPSDEFVEIKFGDTKLSMDKDGTVTVEASQKVIIDAPVAEFTGNVDIAGNVEVSGNVDVFGDLVASEVSTSGGIVLSTHTHVGSPTAPTGAISPTGAPI